MSEFDGGASAPAASAPASNSDAADIVQTPNPVSTEPRAAPEPKAEPEPKKEPTSARDALRKAREQVNAREKGGGEPGDRPKPVASEGPNRDPGGKFTPKEGRQPPKYEPASNPVQAEPAKSAESKPQSFTDDDAKVPGRFHDGAKAEWATTPQSVRAEVARMEREFTEGYRKYKDSADAFEPVRKFHDMARQGGTTLETALTKYVNMENLLRQDPIRGLQEVCNNLGVSLRDMASHILGQPADQQASQQDATIRDLRQQVQQLTQAVGGVANTFQMQQKTATLSEIDAFAAQHPRFEELSEDIAFFLESGRAKGLIEALSLAEKLNPAAEPVKSATEPSAARSAPVAQTDKGQKSITGAPSSGSDPVTSQRPSSSIREALKRAKMAAG